MRFLLRLLGGLWIATLLTTVGFAWLEVREERAALVHDLERRAAVAVDAVREGSERLVARRAPRSAYDRVLARFSRADRGVAIYDELGGVLAASPEVKPDLGVISPLVSEAIRRDTAVRGMRVAGGRPTWVHVLPLQSEDKPVGAAAVLLDARHLETSEWSLWRRTAVRLGVLGLLLTGITWAVVRWSITRPTPRSRQRRRSATTSSGVPARKPARRQPAESAGRGGKSRRACSRRAPTSSGVRPTRSGTMSEWAIVAGSRPTARQ